MTSVISRSHDPFLLGITFGRNLLHRLISVVLNPKSREQLSFKAIGWGRTSQNFYNHFLKLVNNSSGKTKEILAKFMLLWAFWKPLCERKRSYSRVLLDWTIAYSCSWWTWGDLEWPFVAYIHTSRRDLDNLQLAVFDFWPNPYNLVRFLKYM